MAQGVRSNHGPSAPLKYIFYMPHAGEGVGRLCVAGVEPHHLLGAELQADLSLAACSPGWARDPMASP